MHIGYKDSKFYHVTFPSASEFGDFSLTETEIEEYKELIIMNPHWEKELSEISSSQLF